MLPLSWRTGGRELNLTAVVHVFIMEFSWNPILEQTYWCGLGKQRTAVFLGCDNIFSSAKNNRLCKTRLTTGDLRKLFFT
ncbi:hypothetical protein KXD40_003907 [Peronospora effusa]|uniref:Uncharacterized protein n=1 Tax=Peronospora effusa TaxID=542832 RepID=A0A3M6VU61_9STRA|nr:hypothetical protein DD238_000217 [Peronospora effusa]UIZ22917.1 hypothetical protein KXD40_003907 [Peronospora effusa]